MNTTHLKVFLIISILTACYLTVSIGKQLLKKKNDEFMYGLIIGFMISIIASFWFGKLLSIRPLHLLVPAIGVPLLLFFVVLVVGDTSETKDHAPTPTQFDVVE